MRRKGRMFVADGARWLGVSQLAAVEWRMECTKAEIVAGSYLMQLASPRKQGQMQWSIDCKCG